MKTGKLILRANATWLSLAASGGLAADIAGAFFDKGPFAVVFRNAPSTAIGSVEAHGLALIFGVLLWGAPPVRTWHQAALAVHALLGTANLVFWQLFVNTGTLAMGYITTLLHLTFVA
jgi:hypothetical protein